MEYAEFSNDFSRANGGTDKVDTVSKLRYSHDNMFIQMPKTTHPTTPISISLKPTSFVRIPKNEMVTMDGETEAVKLFAETDLFFDGKLEFVSDNGVKMYVVGKQENKPQYPTVVSFKNDAPDKTLRSVIQPNDNSYAEMNDKDLAQARSSLSNSSTYTYNTRIASNVRPLKWEYNADIVEKFNKYKDETETLYTPQIPKTPIEVSKWLGLTEDENDDMPAVNPLYVGMHDMYSDINGHFNVPNFRQNGRAVNDGNNSNTKENVKDSHESTNAVKFEDDGEYVDAETESELSKDDVDEQKETMEDYVQQSSSSSVKKQTNHYVKNITINFKGIPIASNVETDLKLSLANNAKIVVKGGTTVFMELSEGTWTEMVVKNDMGCRYRE